MGKAGGGMATFSPSGAHRLFLLRMRSAFLAAAAKKKVQNQIPINSLDLDNL
jgi:hypothetical protein